VVEFTVDIHDVIYVHIDKKKKFPATALLRAFGYGTNADILKLFYAVKENRHHRQARGPRAEARGARHAAGGRRPRSREQEGRAAGARGDELVLERFNAFRRAGITSVKVFAGYTSLDLREDAQPTTTQQTPTKYVLAFDVADPMGKSSARRGVSCPTR